MELEPSQANALGPISESAGNWTEPPRATVQNFFDRDLLSVNLRATASSAWSLVPFETTVACYLTQPFFRGANGLVCLFTTERGGVIEG
jgi:hypothetical protein